MLNGNVTDCTPKWNELLKVQLISRARLLKSEELSAGDSEVGTRSEEFRSINKHEHLPVAQTGPIHRSTFCGFVLFIVNCRTLATRNCAAEKPEAVEVNRSYWRLLKSLKRHGQCQLQPVLIQQKRMKQSKRRMHFPARMSLKQQDLK